MLIVCPLPSCYLIIVSVAPAVSPSLPSSVSLYSILVSAVLCWSVVLRRECFMLTVLQSYACLPACLFFPFGVVYVLLFDLVIKTLISSAFESSTSSLLTAHAVRSRPRSAPWAHAFRCGPGAHALRSGPGAHALRSRAGSVLGAHALRSRARSVPGAHAVRSRARSIPGAHAVSSRARSAPGAHAVHSGPGPRSGLGTHRARSRASPTLAPLCAHCSRPSSTPQSWPTSLLDIFLFSVCGASGICSLKGGGVMSRSCWCAQAGHQMSLCVEHMACCLFSAMCSHVDCLSPPILLLNHCFSVSLVTLVCLPI